MRKDPPDDATAEPEQTDDAPLRGEIRSADYRRVSHGLFVRRLPDQDADQGREFLRDLRAWLLVLPEDAVFTHVTAARLLGWQLPALPEQVPVFCAVAGDVNRPRRPGLICSRLVRDHEPLQRHGLPIDRPEEILLRCARDLGTLDLMVLIDSARRAGHVDDARMEKLLASRRPGVRALAVAWRRSSARAQSGPETILRAFHDAIHVPVEPQAVIVDDEGRVLAEADLLVIGTTWLHEYDGAHHREGSQQTTDLRRERGLAGSGYRRRGFTLDDLLNHPLVAMHEIDRALSRTHDLRRLTRWRALVDNSLYSETGRQRVLNRWHRAMGVVDWSRTA